MMNEPKLRTDWICNECYLPCELHITSESSDTAPYLCPLGLYGNGETPRARWSKIIKKPKGA
jgi:hypothetical protein